MRLAWLVLLAGCHSSSVSSSYRDSVQAMCDLPDHVPPKDKDYTERLADVMKWANDHVTDPEVKKLGSIDKDVNKEQLVAAAKKAGIEHCKLADNGMALQSFADAMRDVCDAPVREPDKMAVYIKSHLLNQEVIRFVGSIGELSPADRKAKLYKLVERAGITTCPMVEETP